MIEILMGTFNGSAFLEEQINSILEQSFSAWKLLIRDDGSTDDTVALLEKYVKMYPDKICVMKDHSATGEAKKNFLRLIQEASAEYVMFCDQDDVWDRDKIEVTYQYMHRMEKKYGKDIPILVHTDLRVVDSEKKMLSDSFLSYMNLPVKKGIRDLIIQNSVTGCTVIINRKLLEMMKQIDESAPILMHDHIGALLAGAYGKVGFLNRTTMQYRQHEENSVGAADAKNLRYKLMRFKRGRKQFRQDMEDSNRQVGFLLETFGKENMEPEVCRLLEEYSQLYQKSKWEKVKFFVKNRVYKHGFTRRLMQLLWA